MSRNVLTNFNYSVEGRGYAGDASKVDLPDLEVKVEGFNAGGYTAEVEIALGRLAKAMEIEVTYNTFTPDVMKSVATMPNNTFNHVFQGAYTTPNGVVSRKITARAFAKNIKEEPWEPGKKISMTSKLTVHYYRDEWDGKVMNEVDPENCVLIIDGVDLAKGVREAIGL